MIKLWTALGIIGLIGLILFFIYREGEKKGKVNEVVKKQEIEIKEHKQEIKKVYEVIETKKNQQKIINKSSDSIDIIARTEWMRLIFEERRASSETD